MSVCEFTLTAILLGAGAFLFGWMLGGFVSRGRR
jgi:hypothetical protein